MRENEGSTPARVYVIGVVGAVALAAVTIGVANFLRPNNQVDLPQGLGSEPQKQKDSVSPLSEETPDVQTVKTNLFIDAHRAEEYYQLARRLHKENGSVGVGGLANALHRSEKWYRKAMDAGHPEAHSTFGVFYMHVDREEAIQIFKEGAEMGFPSAMFQYALFGVLRSGDNDSGQRTPKAEREAFLWARRAAEGGYPDAMCYTAFAYLGGNSVKKDLQEAFRWFTAGARAGDVISMRYLGYMYFNGDGVRQNRREAYRWFLRAHSTPPESSWMKSDQESAFYLGIMRLWGIGTERNGDRAKYYLGRSGYWESRLEEELSYLQRTDRIGEVTAYND